MRRQSHGVSSEVAAPAHRLKLLVLVRDAGAREELARLRGVFDLVEIDDTGNFAQAACLFAFHCIVLLPGGTCAAHLAVRDLRQRGVALPIVVLGRTLSAGDRVAAYRAGADECAALPLDVDELVARIHSLLRRAHGLAASQWRIGDLSIGLEDQVVRINDAPCRLTPLEFAILRELALAGGNVVSRRALVDRAWGPSECPSDGAIEFQVHRLRRRIGRHRVLTVRGVGYALTDGMAAASDVAR